MSSNDSDSDTGRRVAPPAARKQVQRVEGKARAPQVGPKPTQNKAPQQQQKGQKMVATAPKVAESALKRARGAESSLKSGSPPLLCPRHAPIQLPDSTIEA